jgi:hypothetical protein
MFFKKKIPAVVILSIIVITGIAAARLPGLKYKNLRILPEDISEQKLDSIMKSYCTALKVECNFCHVPFPGFPDSLDYASDKEPMKENARDMMRMTIYINKTYFNLANDQRPEYLLNTVQCMTCHRGEAYPLEED